MRKDSAGFTLIELIIIIIIVGILSAVGISRYMGLQQDARDAVAKRVLDALRGANTEVYTRYAIRCSATPYTMGEIGSMADISGVDGYGSDATRFTLTVNGVIYTFTLEGPTLPTTPGNIRAATAGW